MKGKTWKCSLPPFGESVLWMPLGKPKVLNKLENKWREGHFLGMKEGTSEYLVGTPDGVVRARCLKRLPASEEQDRSTGVSLMLVNGVPWCPMPGGEGESVPISIRFDRVEEYERNSPDAIVEKRLWPKMSDPRQVYVKTKDIKQYGYSTGCPGCRAIETGKTPVPHSQQCRERVVEELQKTDEGQR